MRFTLRVIAIVISGWIILGFLNNLVTKVAWPINTVYTVGFWVGEILMLALAQWLLRWAFKRKSRRIAE